MKIVHVAPFYHPVVGGVEEVVRHIAEYMAGRGYDVYVITYNRLRRGGIGSLPKEEVINNVKVIRLKPRIIWSYGSYSPELPEVIKILKPDIVHIHVWRHPHVFQVAKLKKEVGFKAVLHGHAPFHRFSQLGVVTWIYHRFVDSLGRNFLKSFDLYVALTRYERRIVSKLGFNEDGIIIIPNGIDEDNCNINFNSKAENQILYLGRIDRSKNLTLLIKSMRYVSEKIKNTKLILAGTDEGLVENLIDYARRHNINVQYLGEVYGGFKHKLYLESKIYVLPSLYEAFGITLLEAGIHGTPSVITGSGGQIEVAPPGLASLWAEPKPKKYGEAITVLLTDETLNKRLGLQARRWAQQFTWNKILPRYEELYRRLLA